MTTWAVGEFLKMTNRSPAASSSTANHASQTVRFRAGAVQDVAEILDDLQIARLMLVLDRPAWSLSGAEAVLGQSLKQWQVVTLDEFQLNPKLEDIQRGVALFREHRPQAVVAIGGGSAIDVAKIVGSCGANEASPRDYISGKRALNVEGPPLIAVTTTAGTGSEATHFAVAYIEGKKYSLAHQFLLPKYVILDPALTYSLPAGITVASGLDALCQAIESMWAVGATDESFAYASQAMQLAIENLPIAASRATHESRRAMLQAAHLAGQAINIGKTTAPHAVSYAFTSRYGVPHGIAVALTLAPFLRYNSEVDDTNCLDRRGPQHVRQRTDRIVQGLGGVNVADACKRWEAMLTQLSCPTRLRDARIQIEDLPMLADEVNAERVANNPRRVDRAALLDLLSSSY